MIIHGSRSGWKIGHGGTLRAGAIAIGEWDTVDEHGDEPGRPRMEEVIDRARAGDRSAFERLYRENVGRVYALCLRMSADPALAEELTQDVFVKAWRKLGSFRGESAFTSWLHRIAVNTVFQRQRSEKRRRARREAARWLSPLGGCEAGWDGPGVGIDLERAIAGLPAGARQVFVLREIEGYRYREIAELSGLAVGTLKAQMHRARELLREALDR